MPGVARAGVRPGARGTPRSVSDVFTQLLSKYGALQSVKHNEVDVATLVLDLDEATLRHEGGS